MVRIDIDDNNETIADKSIVEILDIARKAFNSGKTKSLKFRKNQLKALERFLVECEEEIVQSLAKDLNKHRQESMMSEVDATKQEIREALIKLSSWMKPENSEKRIINFWDKVEVYHDPYGVVLIMSAWNYPYFLLLGPFIGAISGGNCVILKPSELSPATATTLARNLPKFLDPQCFHVFTGGVEETTELLKQKFDYIFFTGSTTVGKIVHQAAAKYLTPVTLELGGKSPVFLDDSADIKKATRRILWGKCLNSGQTCIAPDYLLCSEKTQEKFIEASREIVNEFYGDDVKTSEYFGKIVTDRHFNRLIKFLECGVIALGGDFDNFKRKIAPTILTNIHPEDAVMQEEIFGPILPIITVNSPQDAVNFINSRDKPLALYIFTKNQKIRDFFLTNTSSGGVCINDTLMHAFTENLPFGGVGDSGMGNYHCKYGFDTFTHHKGVLTRNLDTISELMSYARYPPYSDTKMNFLSFVGKKRRCLLPFQPLKFICIFFIGLGLGIAFMSF